MKKKKPATPPTVPDTNIDRLRAIARLAMDTNNRTIAETMIDSIGDPWNISDTIACAEADDDDCRYLMATMQIVADLRAFLGTEAG